MTPVPRTDAAAAAEARSVRMLRAELSAAEYRQLIVLAAMRGVTVQALIGDALRHYLHHTEAKEA